MYVLTVTTAQAIVSSRKFFLLDVLIDPPTPRSPLSPISQVSDEYYAVHHSIFCSLLNAERDGRFPDGAGFDADELGKYLTERTDFANFLTPKTDRFRIALQSCGHKLVAFTNAPRVYAKVGPPLDPRTFKRLSTAPSPYFPSFILTLSLISILIIYIQVLILCTVSQAMSLTLTLSVSA